MAVDTRGRGLWFFVDVDSGFSSAVRVRRQGAWIP